MTLARSFCGTLLIAACYAAAGCDKPIRNIADLNGCYFANGPNPIFEIRQSKLLSPLVTSAVTIPSSTSDASVISFSPGIRITESEQKSMIVDRGPETGGLTFQRGKKRYILLPGSGIPVQLEQRDCTVPSSRKTLAE